MVRYSSWSAMFAVASVGLAAILWFQTTRVPSKSEMATMPKPAGAATPNHPTTPAARLGEPNAYSAIAERPLFARTRRPPEDAPVEVAPKTRVSLPNFILKGSVITTEEKYILLQKRASGETIRLYEGQSVDGWRIETILPDGVIVKSGEKTEKIELWSEQVKAARQPAKAPTRRPNIKLPAPHNRRQ